VAISSPGVGSGLDINSIVTQLAAVEKKPLVTLQNNATKLQTQLSAFGKLKSQLASLQDAAQKLLDTDTWGAKTFTSSSASAVSGSAGTDSKANSFKVRVGQLATVQTMRSSIPIPKITGVDGQKREQTISELGGAGGEITITPNGDAAITVDVLDTDTLSSIVNKINDKTAESGVQAFLVTGDAGQSLQLSGTKTGENNTFSVTENMNSGIITGLSQIQSAGNSIVYINANDADTSPPYGGIEVTSSNNTIADAIPGVTLNLITETTSNVQITVGTDTDTIKTKIQGFQDAYNTLIGNLQDLTKYDATTKKAGTLQADGTAVGLLSLLRTMISSTAPKATYDYLTESKRIKRLSDVGLEVQQDGSLKTNTTKLTSSLSNLDNVKTFFYQYKNPEIVNGIDVAATSTSTTDGFTTNENGLARRIRDFARTANGIQGTISLKNVAIQSAINRNSVDQDKENTKVAEYQKRLYQQYSSLDSKMGSLNGLSNFVSTQVAQWNKSK